MGQTDSVRKQDAVPESSEQDVAERNWLATNFLYPIRFRSSNIHRRPGSHCAKPAGSGLVPGDRVRFGPNGSAGSGSKPVCKNHQDRFWLTLPCRIRIGCEWDPACLLGNPEVRTLSHSAVLHTYDDSKPWFTTSFFQPLL